MQPEPAAVGLLELQQMLMSLQHMEDKEESIRRGGGGGRQGGAVEGPLDRAVVVTCHGAGDPAME